MKIFVLGGDGMLGHQLLQCLQARHTVKLSLRQSASAYRSCPLFTKENSYFDIDILHTETLLEALLDFRPDAVINAVGVVKQRAAAKESIPSLEINALLPHRLAQLCRSLGARLIHMSTDCVFSGKKGNYVETDFADAYDLYGRSKFLGELHEDHCVTIRSSIIGLELSRKTSLIEWFLAQTGNIKGFREAIYTGITTLEMSRLIEKILMQHTNLSGVWHVASKPINKFDLLQLFSEKLGREDIRIAADDEFVCDRSLCGDRFAQMTGYQAPSWDHMLEDLAHQVKSKHEVVAA